jgi:hypothetical protein
MGLRDCPEWNIFRRGRFHMNPSLLTVIVFHEWSITQVSASVKRNDSIYYYTR